MKGMIELFLNAMAVYTARAKVVTIPTIKTVNSKQWNVFCCMLSSHVCHSKARNNHKPNRNQEKNTAYTGRYDKDDFPSLPSLTTFRLDKK